MFHFDTNHCHALLEGAPAMGHQLALHSSASISTCVVVAGELKYMALKSQRASENMLRVNAFLDSIMIHLINVETAEIYSSIKNTVLNAFGPKVKEKRRAFRIESLGFTDNDLWVAASAIQHNEILLTSDRDFSRIASATLLQVEQWWFPGV